MGLFLHTISFDALLEEEASPNWPAFVSFCLHTPGFSTETGSGIGGGGGGGGMYGDIRGGIGGGDGNRGGAGARCSTGGGGGSGSCGDDGDCGDDRRKEGTSDGFDCNGVAEG